MKVIGMEYKTIDACPNDRIICYMDNMQQSWNALNVELLNIELIR